MLVLNPDLINSCRVCRSPNQDGDYECLYKCASKQDKRPVLSEAGILYENLLDISLDTRSYYPQFLCNSCDLQMKLFKKLKDRAYKTFEYLQNLYGEEIVGAKEDTQEVIYEYKENEAAEYQESETNEYQKNIDEFIENAVEGLQEVSLIENQCNTVNEYQEYTTQVHEENTESEYQENASVECYEEGLIAINTYRESEPDSLYKKNEIAYTNASNTVINVSAVATQVEVEPGSNSSKYSYPTEELTHNSSNLNENSPELSFTEEPVIDKNDYVTEIYELLDDESILEETFSEYNDNVEEYICIEETTEDNSVLSDIDYVFEEEICDNQNKNQQEIQNPTKKRKFNSASTRKACAIGIREYRCQLCQLKFKNSQELKLHRTEVHNEKYPCSICSKEFKTMPALHFHMKIHDEPAYQCEICQKTFNQKGHYNYHMNRHNNVRNFKCDLCEKAFLSKSDLKIHLRLHTKKRPYVCNICGKDYLMMEHLKTHLIKHTDQSFQCEICQHKFTTHKTLRLHVKTIHEDEPRFKCNFCSKPFRRKHHLEYHLKLHPQSVNCLDSGYELIDDPGFGSAGTDYNPEELDEHDSIDEAGFIALNDGVI